MSLENAGGTLVFSDRFPDRPSPDHKTILRVLARAQETGKVLPNRNEIGGSARTARTLANHLRRDCNKGVVVFTLICDRDWRTESVVHRVIANGNILD
jgi:hypothetical protein